LSKIMPPAHPFDSSYLRDADDGDKLKEECGVFGVIGVADASNFVALGLHALQHRGQEAGGIVSYDPAAGFHVVRKPAGSSAMTPLPVSSPPAASAMCETTSPRKR